jgi:purine-binding chemotaxis protein CheW
MIALLTFETADRRFAVPASLVLEVVRAVAISPLPKSPPIVEGIINYRGTLVPVLDIRQRFGLAPLPLAPEQHFLIVLTDSRPVALRVDRALDLVSIEESLIQPVDPIAPGSEYVAGLAKLPDGLLIIHDLERFLSLQESHHLQAAILEAGA